jgi:hypothetical protein
MRNSISDAVILTGGGGMSRSAKNEDQYGKQETLRRADAALKRMLSMPHKPHKPIGSKAKRKKGETGRKKSST